MEEAFGGLVRSGQFNKRDIKNYLVIGAKRKSRKFYAEAIEKYIDEA